jgi:hypothetical protein
MKIQDIITENQANVREGRLNEFAPGGSEGNGPFEYGTAIIQIGQDFVDTYSDEGAGADAAAIIKVGRKFMSAGMKAGIRAFYAMDTQLRDHVAEELEDQGFNVRKDIYEPHDKSLPATTLTRPVTDADRDWYLLQDLIKEFGKARQGSVDPKTLEQLRQDFGWSLQMGFEELPKKSIRADFTDFAKSKGVDFTAMAKKYQGFRPVAEGSDDFSRNLAAFRVYQHLDPMEFYNFANTPRGLKTLAQKAGTTPESVKDSLERMDWGQFPDDFYQDPEDDEQRVTEGVEPTEQAMDQSISDLVKDAMGTRPNNDWMQRWMAMSADKKLALYQQLASQLD